LYEIPGTDRYVVQGDRVADAAELDQLDNLTAEEGAVIVPRELLANFGPKEPVHVPQFITFDAFGGMFAKLKHSAWRLETRRRYASDEETDTYRQFLTEGRVDWDLEDPWCTGRREQSALGKRPDVLAAQARNVPASAAKRASAGAEAPSTPRLDQLRTAAPERRRGQVQE
jgi:hypothetical protein